MRTKLVHYSSYPLLPGLTCEHADVLAKVDVFQGFFAGHIDNGESLGEGVGPAHSQPVSGSRTSCQQLGRYVTM